MSDKLKEDLSALMDGELAGASAAETLDVLIESDELKVHWARYHVVRDVLRHKVYPVAGSALRDRVRESIADEPHIFSRPRMLPRRWRETLKPVAGMALAASVAVVAVLAVRSGDHAPAQPDIAAAPTTRVAASTATPMTGAAIPVAALDQVDPRPMPLRQLHWSTDEPAIAQRLNGYLVNHSELRGGPIAGMHPYVRIVGYDTARQR